ncbi:MAG: DUF1016 family protein, partial [Candidatus Delongbacteria bacterium]|nr:DUF1016 family protein [Candidatus Delongbacteria bacterium]
MKIKNSDNNFVADVKGILEQARNNAYRAINSAMVQAYWLVGKRIVEEEQKGKERAEYGKQIIKTLSKELTSKFGKGFSSRSIWEYRQFYFVFPDIENMRTTFAQSESTIMRTVFAQLNWSQIRLIMRLTNRK